jgi:hypothetical protein
MRSMSDMSSIEEVKLPDPDGRMIRLGDLWSEHRVIVVWLRHYG